MTRKGRRLTFIGSALALGGCAVALILFVLRDNVVFFFSPTEISAKAVGPGVHLRLGGLVKDGTLVRSESKSIAFSVTDLTRDIAVTYTGVVPDLFREGQGVVVEGALDQSGIFRATTGLAKHDERYMPREVADALKKQGVWQGGTGAPPGGAPKP